MSKPGTPARATAGRPPITSLRTLNCGVVCGLVLGGMFVFAQMLDGCNKALEDSTPVQVWELWDPDVETRQYAANRLRKRGPEAAPFAQHLAEMVAKDPDPWARQLAAQALAAIGPAAAEFAPTLDSVAKNPATPPALRADVAKALRAVRGE